jgi:hypothetical protein
VREYADRSGLVSRGGFSPADHRRKSEPVEALAVTPDQMRFVSSVRESILEAAEEPDAQAL